MLPLIFVRQGPRMGGSHWLAKQAVASRWITEASGRPFNVHCNGFAVAATKHLMPLWPRREASYLTMSFGFACLKPTVAVVGVVSTVTDSTET